MKNATASTATSTDEPQDGAPSAPSHGARTGTHPARARPRRFGSGRSASSANGSTRPDPLPLAPPRSVRSRVPQALLAALLIVGGGLGGLLLFSRYNQRSPAVVVTQPVRHGDILDREDLAITEVAVGGDVATVSALSEVAGRFAAHDLEAGELVSPADLATEDQLVGADESVIGLLLEPGQYPTRRLAPGDRVDVFAPGGDADGALVGSDGEAIGATPAATAGEPLAADLVIFDVVESSSDGRTLLVSLVVTDRQAAAVFEASEANEVRLALRGQE